MRVCMCVFHTLICASAQCEYKMSWLLCARACAQVCVRVCAQVLIEFKIQAFKETHSARGLMLFTGKGHIIIKTCTIKQPHYKDAYEGGGRGGEERKHRNSLQATQLSFFYLLSFPHELHLHVLFYQKGKRAYKQSREEFMYL